MTRPERPPEAVGRYAFAAQRRAWIAWRWAQGDIAQHQIGRQLGFDTNTAMTAICLAIRRYCEEHGLLRAVSADDPEMIYGDDRKARLRAHFKSRPAPPPPGVVWRPPGTEPVRQAPPPAAPSATAPNPGERMARAIEAALPRIREMWQAFYYAEMEGDDVVMTELRAAADAWRQDQGVAHCGWCGKTFASGGGTGRRSTAKWCSNRCKVAASHASRARTIRRQELR